MSDNSSEDENDLIKELEEDEDVYTVSELNDKIKNVFRLMLSDKISVLGEVSNMKISRDNLYMNLKDNDAMINVVFWSYNKRHHSVELKNGCKVVVKGCLTIYNKSGTYQINAKSIEVSGTGDLWKDYILIKKQYEDLGYFSDENKKPIPKHIKDIGVITAIDGAALKDFLFILKKNHFVGNVYVKGCIVQGKNCPTSVKNSLEELDKNDYDIIVVTRGGGGFEDLFGFSNSEVIESIFKTKTCTISAIGHEIDFMLSDYVADIRAPTPSIAGEIIVSQQKNSYNFENIFNTKREMQMIILKRLNTFMSKLNEMEKKIGDHKKIIDNYGKLMFDTKKEFEFLLRNRIIKFGYELDNMLDKYRTKNPKKVLENGYSIILDENNDVVNSKKAFIRNFKEEKKLKIQFLDGFVYINHME